MGEGDPERRKDGHDRSGDGDVFWTSRRWWRRTGHTAAGVWIANLLSILGTIVAARALGPSEYGSVLLALAAVHAVSILLDITLEEATNFYGNRALHDGDIAGLRALLRLSLKVDIAIGVVVTALVVALSGALAEIASDGRLDPTLVQISALSVLVMTADSTAFAALALARRVDLRARALAATSAFRLVGVIIAVQLGGRRRSQSRTCSAARREAWFSGSTHGARAGAGGRPSPARSRRHGRWAPGSWCVSGSTRA